MKVGLEFSHRHWQDESGKPLRCRITKIARGSVYYRPVGGGAPMVCAVESFGRYANV